MRVESWFMRWGCSRLCIECAAGRHSVQECFANRKRERIDIDCIAFNEELRQF